jgi:hypothetical protein
MKRKAKVSSITQRYGCYGLDLWHRAHFRLFPLQHWLNISYIPLYIQCMYGIYALNLSIDRSGSSTSLWLTSWRMPSFRIFCDQDLQKWHSRCTLWERLNAMLFGSILQCLYFYTVAGIIPLCDE